MMNEPLTKINTRFIPTTHYQDGAYYVAVRMESNIHETRTTIYELSFDSAEVAMTYSKWFAESEAAMYRRSMESTLGQMRRDH